ncbi:hypothetical protein Tco_0157234 [Tanacetum coccineum]
MAKLSISKDVKTIKDMKKVLFYLFEVNIERRAFMEELERLKYLVDTVRSVLFFNGIQRRDVEEATYQMIMIKELHAQTSENVSFLRKIMGFSSI